MLGLELCRRRRIRVLEVWRWEVRDIVCLCCADYVCWGGIVGCFGAAGHVEGGHRASGSVCGCEVSRERGVGVASRDGGEVVWVGRWIVLRVGLVVEGKAVGRGCCEGWGRRGGRP